MHMQTFSKDAAHKHLFKVFEQICVYADSSYSLGVLIKVRAEGFKALSSVTFDPTRYDNSYSFSKDYCVYAFGRKLEPLKEDPSLKKEAFSAFIRAELHCRSTNDNFRLRTNPNGRLESLISRAQQVIRRILPDVTRCREAMSCRFGPGATFSLKGEEANWANKIREDRISVTADSFGLARALLSNDPHLFETRYGVLPDGPFSLLHTCFEIVQGSRLITVPKTSKTDRSICVEPSANVMLQKGAGAVIRSSLKKYGIDLNDQSRNQELARLAYTNGYSTIDLESASDTMSHGLVLELLPLDWYLYLDSLRSKSFTVDGAWFEFEKFSAMGNGFTFELESLLFYALAAACVPLEERKDIAVFGDDIIVPRAYAPLLIELLEYVGFLPNKQKTFIDGNFFESCGKHYFQGFDVTPIYQKEIPYDEAAIYRLANRLYRFSCRQYGGGPDTDSCTKALRRAWLIAWRVIERPLLVPITDEDVGVMVRNGNNFLLHRRGKLLYHALIPYARKIPVGDSDALAYTLRFQPGEPVTGLLSLRSRPRYRYGMRRFWIQF
ncbi:RNA-directed RNA polymerase [ssRNA phage SRR7473382_3]|uniref:RNA-directed RNA polymerase n=1 Tax=ssRNA phage SRR7473382_3 TaxID=2786628 RepID=A0A8S5L0A1_9VIRU|nr:RNA-directed RNA polymerase [ssRNA phage SRR7473382_3]DAD50757.1 TPA_asm: RNA-directed RNA polymerase [ssRNA phage SRR7473382_3]